MIKKVIGTFICGILFCSPVGAQQTEEMVVQPSLNAVMLQEEMVAQGDAEEEVPSQEELVKEEALDDGMVSLDFRDADIQNVLRVLSYKSGVNIVAGPEVAGLVTIQLEKVPWQRALDVVLETYGYAYDRRGNIITVTTVENLKKRREDALVLAEQEPLVTRTFVLNYAKAADVIKSVEKMRTQRGSINYDERINAVIVRDTTSNLEMMEKVMEDLDKTTPQILIEAKIIETTLGNTEKLGIDWSVAVDANGAEWSTSWPLTKDSGTSPSKAFFPDISGEDIPFTYGTLDFTSFSAALEMLESRNDTNTLSNPRIVTLDNQPARIVVGRLYPFPEYTYNQERGEMQVSGWEYKDIGVIFEVTPHVNSAGMVTLDLKPTVTAIIADAEVQVEGTTVPQLTTREAKTKVMVKDGDTLVIGGLISDVITDNESRMPFLGDIPLLGRLFRYNSSVKSKTDLLIFLTPHIITPEELPEK
ncbi:MAG TPA: type IV pilus secretin PilQ [Candidatus Bathyarchaeia archaeon]|nr:type IV pilus secretin PilQ [Candidatus Bathyarchaeia archaeon]